MGETERQAGEGALVGPQREAVQVLLDAYDAVATSGRPHLAVLEAPTGLGKTRVVQELYERLVRERQPDGLHWSSGLVRDDARYDVARKLVRPPVPTGDGPLPWLWLGAHCARLDTGEPRSAVRQEVAEQVLLLSAVRDAEGRQREALVRLLLRFGSGLVPFVPQAAALVEAYEQVREPVDAVLEALSEGREAVEAREDDAERLRAKERHADDDALLARLDLARRGPGGERVPLVLVLDDVHDLGAAELELVARLVTETPERSAAGRLVDRLRTAGRATQTPVLLVLTRWPAAHTAASRDAEEALEALAGLLEADGVQVPGVARVLHLSGAEGLRPLGLEDAERVLARLQPERPERERRTALEALLSRSAGGLLPKRVAWLAEELQQRSAQGVPIDDAWCADLRVELDAEARRQWEALDEQARALVQTAALGRDPQRARSLQAQLEEQLSLPRGRAREVLEDVVRRGILVEDPERPGWVRFGPEHRDFARSHTAASRTHFHQQAVRAACRTARSLLADYGDEALKPLLAALALPVVEGVELHPAVRERFPDVVCWAHAAVSRRRRAGSAEQREEVAAAVALLPEQQDTSPGSLVARFLLDGLPRDPDGLVQGVPGSGRRELLLPALAGLGPRLSTVPLVVDGLLRLRKLSLRHAQAEQLAVVLARAAHADAGAAQAVLRLPGAGPAARETAWKALLARAEDQPGAAATLHGLARTREERTSARAAVEATAAGDPGSASLVLTGARRAGRDRVLHRLAALLDALAAGTALSPRDAAYLSQVLDLALDTVLGGRPRAKLLEAASRTASCYEPAALAVLRHGSEDERRRATDLLLARAPGDLELALQLGRRCTDREQLVEVCRVLEQHWRASADVRPLLELARRTPRSDTAERTRVEMLLREHVDDVRVVRTLLRLSSGLVQDELRAELRDRALEDPAWVSAASTACAGTTHAALLVEALAPRADEEPTAALAVHVLAEDEDLRETARERFTGLLRRRPGAATAALAEWRDAELCVRVLRGPEDLRGFVRALLSRGDELLAHDVALRGCWELLDEARSRLQRAAVVQPVVAAALSASALAVDEREQAHALLLRHARQAGTGGEEGGEEGGEVPVVVARALVAAGAVEPSLRRAVVAALRARATEEPVAAVALHGLEPHDPWVAAALEAHAHRDAAAAEAVLEGAAASGRPLPAAPLALLRARVGRDPASAEVLARLRPGDDLLLPAARRVAAGSGSARDRARVQEGAAATDAACLAALLAAGERPDEQSAALAALVQVDRLHVCRTVVAVLPRRRGLLAQAPSALRRALTAFARVDPWALLLVLPLGDEPPAELRDALRRHAPTSRTAAGAWLRVAVDLEDKAQALELALPQASALPADAVLDAARLAVEVGSTADLDELVRACAGRARHRSVEALLRGDRAELRRRLRQALDQDDVEEAVFLTRLARDRKVERSLVDVLRDAPAGRLAVVAASACVPGALLPLSARDWRLLEDAAASRAVCAGLLELDGARAGAQGRARRQALARRWAWADLRCLVGLAALGGGAGRQQRQRLVALAEDRPRVVRRVLSLAPRSAALREDLVQALVRAGEDDPRACWELARLARADGSLRPRARDLLATHALDEPDAVAWLAALVESGDLPAVRRLAAHHGQDLERIGALARALGVTGSRAAAVLDPEAEVGDDGPGAALPRPPYLEVVVQARAHVGLPSRRTAALEAQLEVPARLDADARAARARLRADDEAVAGARSELAAALSTDPATGVLLRLLAADPAPARVLAAADLLPDGALDGEVYALRPSLGLPAGADGVTVTALLRHVRDRARLARLLPVGSALREAVIEALAGPGGGHEGCGDALAAARMLAEEARSQRACDKAFRLAREHAGCSAEAVLLAAGLAHDAKATRKVREDVDTALARLGRSGDARAARVLLAQRSSDRRAPLWQRQVDALADSEEPAVLAVLLSVLAVPAQRAAAALERVGGDPVALADLAALAGPAGNRSAAQLPGLLPLLRARQDDPVCAAHLAVQTDDEQERHALLLGLEPEDGQPHEVVHRLLEVLWHEDSTLAAAARLAGRWASRCATCAAALAGTGDPVVARRALEPHLEAEPGRVLQALLRAPRLVGRLSALLPADDPRLDDVGTWLSGTTAPALPAALALAELAATVSPHLRDSARARLRLVDSAGRSYACALALAELADTPMREREAAGRLRAHQGRQVRRKGLLQLLALEPRGAQAEQDLADLRRWLPGDLPCAVAALDLTAGRPAAGELEAVVAGHLPAPAAALALLRHSLSGDHAAAARTAAVDHVEALAERDPDAAGRFLRALPPAALEGVVDALLERRAVPALAAVHVLLPSARTRLAPVLAAAVLDGPWRSRVAAALAGTGSVPAEQLLAALPAGSEESASGRPAEDVARARLLLVAGEEQPAVAAVRCTPTTALVGALVRAGVDAPAFVLLTAEHPRAVRVLLALSASDAAAAVLLARVAAAGQRQLAARARAACASWPSDLPAVLAASALADDPWERREALHLLEPHHEAPEAALAAVRHAAALGEQPPPVLLDRLRPLAADDAAVAAAVLPHLPAREVDGPLSAWAARGSLAVLGAAARSGLLEAAHLEGLPEQVWQDASGAVRLALALDPGLAPVLHEQATAAAPQHAGAALVALALTAPGAPQRGPAWNRVLGWAQEDLGCAADAARLVGDAAEREHLRAVLLRHRTASPALVEALVRLADEPADHAEVARLVEALAPTDLPEALSRLVLAVPPRSALRSVPASRRREAARHCLLQADQDGWAAAVVLLLVDRLRAEERERAWQLATRFASQDVEVALVVADVARDPEQLQEAKGLLEAHLQRDDHDERVRTRWSRVRSALESSTRTSVGSAELTTRADQAAQLALVLRRWLPRDVTVEDPLQVRGALDAALRSDACDQVLAVLDRAALPERVLLELVHPDDWLALVWHNHLAAVARKGGGAVPDALLVRYLAVARHKQDGRFRGAGGSDGGTNVRDAYELLRQRVPHSRSCALAAAAQGSPGAYDVVEALEPLVHAGDADAVVGLSRLAGLLDPPLAEAALDVLLGLGVEGRRSLPGAVGALLALGAVGSRAGLARDAAEATDRWAPELLEHALRTAEGEDREDAADELDVAAGRTVEAALLLAREPSSARRARRRLLRHAPRSSAAAQALLEHGDAKDLAERAAPLVDLVAEGEGLHVVRPLLRVLAHLPAPERRRLLVALVDRPGQLPEDEVAALAVAHDEDDLVHALAGRSVLAAAASLRLGSEDRAAVAWLRQAAGGRDDAAAWLALVLPDEAPRRALPRLRRSGRDDTRLLLLSLWLPRPADRLALARAAGLVERMRRVLRFAALGSDTAFLDYCSFCEDAGLPLTEAERQRAAALVALPRTRSAEQEPDRVEQS